MKKFKKVLAVLVGIATGGFVIMTGEMISKFFYTALGNPELKTAAEFQKVVDSLPVSFFFYLLFNYAIASFMAGIVATLLSDRQEKIYAVLVGTVLTVGGTANLMMIHHPLWFSICNVPEYILFSFIGYFVAKKRG